MSAETVPYVCDEIPSFVVRGLSKTPDPGKVRFLWSTEADIRDCLATYMWLGGVQEVRTEVQIPNCGRIDILSREGEHRFIIEVKRTLTTVSGSRKAYQQADMYARYMLAETDAKSPGGVFPFVTAAEWSDAATAPAAEAYGLVQGESVADLLGAISEIGLPSAFHGYCSAAERRQRIAERRRVLVSLAEGLLRADRDWAREYERTSLRGVEQVA